MRIACSSCNAAYEVPPERVPPGKSVKCARCGMVWVPVELVDARPAMEVAPERPEPAAAAPMTAAPPPAAAEQPMAVEVLPTPVATASVRAARSSRVPVLLGWLLTVAVLAGLGWAAVRYQAAVTQAWPNAERAYGLFGLREGNRLAP